MFESIKNASQKRYFKMTFLPLMSFHSSSTTAVHVF